MFIILMLEMLVESEILCMNVQAVWHNEYMCFSFIQLLYIFSNNHKIKLCILTLSSQCIFPLYMFQLILLSLGIFAKVVRAIKYFTVHV